MPTLIPVVLPFALVIGVTQTLTAMNTDSELAIIDASGARRTIIYKPVLILGVVLSLVSFGITNFAEPPARAAARQMVAEAYADLLSSVIEEKTFRTIQDGLYVQIGQRQGRILRGLFVADRRDPNYDLIYYAKEGMIDEGGTSLTMRDGEVQQKTPDGRFPSSNSCPMPSIYQPCLRNPTRSRRFLPVMPASPSCSRPIRIWTATKRTPARSDRNCTGVSSTGCFHLSLH